MISSLLSPSCPRMPSLGAGETDGDWKHKSTPPRSVVRVLKKGEFSGHSLGVNEDDEHEEEDEKGVGLLEVDVPHGLGDVRKAVTGEEATQLQSSQTHTTTNTNSPDIY